MIRGESRPPVLRQLVASASCQCVSFLGHCPLRAPFTPSKSWFIMRSMNLLRLAVAIKFMGLFMVLSAVAQLPDTDAPSQNFKLVESILTPDGSAAIDVCASPGPWSNWAVFERNVKTGERRKLDTPFQGMPIQCKPLLSKDGKILVLHSGSGSSGVAPTIFKKGADGWFQGGDDSREVDRWKCTALPLTCRWRIQSLPSPMTRSLQPGFPGCRRIILRFR